MALPRKITLTTSWPVEVAVATPFESTTTNASGGADAIRRFWQALARGAPNAEE